MSSTKINNDTCKTKQVMVMGLGDVGKTTIIEQLQDIHTSQQAEKYKHVNINIQFTETNGYYCKSLRKLAIRKAAAIMLIYAVDDMQSFDYVTKLLTEISNMEEKAMPVVVVANKIDVGIRDVHPVMADCVVTIDYEHCHVETSADRGDGMKCMYSNLLQAFEKSHYCLKWMETINVYYSQL